MFSRYSPNTQKQKKKDIFLQNCFTRKVFYTLKYFTSNQTEHISKYFLESGTGLSRTASQALCEFGSIQGIKHWADEGSPPIYRNPNFQILFGVLLFRRPIQYQFVHVIGSDFGL